MADSKLTTCLWFDKGEARKAAEFYASVSPTRQSDWGTTHRRTSRAEPRAKN
jgi:predicted 3-demethylubiquinone-9 3-methyltransferase (glyoxalase superfamily)